MIKTLKHQTLSIFKIYVIKRKFLLTVNKTTASQNVTGRRKFSSSIDPSPNVGHGIGRGVPNGPFGRDRKSRGSVSQQVRHDKDPSALKVLKILELKFSIPSSSMVTSPHQQNILNQYGKQQDKNPHPPSILI